MLLYKKLSIRSFYDERGVLNVLEKGRDIDFEIKRVYWLKNEKDLPRGAHAHLTGNQALICVNGSVKIKLSDGKQNESVVIRENSDGIMISGTIWREMVEFSDSAVLLVLNDTNYESDKVIRDWMEYLEFTNE